MATKDTSTVASRSLNKPHVKRKGRHSKKKSSRVKTSRHYKKAYRGQGR